MEDFSRKMLHEIREMKVQEAKKRTSAGLGIFLNEAQDTKQSSVSTFIIKSNDVQFGNVRMNQIDNLKKTIGDVSFKEDCLKYFKDIRDLLIEGEINGLEIKFQFRYKDPSGDGCYIWCQGLQLTDSNLRTIQKIRDGFLNWKDSLIEDGDLMEKIHKEASKE